MKRISPQVKAIADAHINAKINGKFDDPAASSKQEVIDLLKSGKTFSLVMLEIERRYVSITSQILQSCLDHTTDAYRRQVYKGFKVLFT